MWLRRVFAVTLAFVPVGFFSFLMGVIAHYGQDLPLWELLVKGFLYVAIIVGVNLGIIAALGVIFILVPLLWED